MLREKCNRTHIFFVTRKKAIAEVRARLKASALKAANSKENSFEYAGEMKRFERLWKTWTDLENGCDCVRSVAQIFGAHTRIRS